MIERSRRLVSWQRVRMQMVIMKIVPGDEAIMVVIEPAIVAVIHVMPMEGEPHTNGK
jgi:hypothetical protein